MIRPRGGPRSVVRRARPRAARGLHVLAEVWLTIAAAVGLACVLGAVALFAFGVTPVVFMSGSMGPEIPTGSLGMVEERPASQVRVGDVVSLIDPDGVRVTHRVVERAEAGGGAVTLTTKGDANSKADQRPTTVAAAEVLVWSAPRLGYLVHYGQRAPVVYLLGALSGGWVVWWFRRPRRGDSAQGDRSDASRPAPSVEDEAASDDARPRQPALFASIAVVGLVAASVSSAEPTRAAFTDSAQMTSRHATQPPQSLVAPTHGTDAAQGARGATSGDPDTPRGTPALVPTLRAEAGGWTYASDGRRFVVQEPDGTRHERDLPGGPIVGLTATYDADRGWRVVAITDGTNRWWSAGVDGDGVAWHRMEPDPRPAAQPDGAAR